MILVTGASGFVGSALVTRLAGQQQAPVRAVLRRSAGVAVAGVEEFLVVAPFQQCDWSVALRSVDTVVHAAARVHQLQDAAADPLAEFRAVNVQSTESLANAAAAAGVRHFVFLSSVKVLGEATAPGEPFTAESPARPQDPYAISKWEAEQSLRRIESASGMRVSIVRPPLVYGPGVRANFRSLLSLVARGVPLPFGAVNNRRSLVSLANLVDLLAVLVRRPEDGGRTLLVSDGEDLSTPELIRRLAAAMARPARLIPVPVGLMSGVGRLLGQRQRLQRLFSSLQVDMGATRRSLGWAPPQSVDQALLDTARHFLHETRR